MDNQLYLVNAFTTEKFRGNPAAIIFLNEEKKRDCMQAWAKELNQPITTFVIRQKDTFLLRWFTPAKEITSCGHGTLGAAHILWQERICPTESTISFETAAGTLYANSIKEGIRLTFSVVETTSTPITDALNHTIDTSIKNAAWAKDRYLLELENEQDIRHAEPDTEAIKNLDGNGLILTSRGITPYDFISRYFPPKIGLDEDYVTGSSHCALAHYWSNSLNKQTFLAYQASKRGGEIYVEIDRASVYLTGNAITLFNGILN